MINRILGIIVEKNPSVVIVDVGGVGYEIGIPVSTFSKLPQIGGKVLLFTHLHIREDSHQLFGFLEEMERSLFGKIIKVSGIGPRVGLAILSTISPVSLISYIEKRSTENLCQIPGIGKKTAERMCLELKSKLSSITIVKAVGGVLSVDRKKPDPLQLALAQLDYRKSEIDVVLSSGAVPTEEEASIEERLRAALVYLAKQP